MRLGCLLFGFQALCQHFMKLSIGAGSQNYFGPPQWGIMKLSYEERLRMTHRLVFVFISIVAIFLVPPHVPYSWRIFSLRVHLSWKLHCPVAVFKMTRSVHEIRETLSCLWSHNWDMYVLLFYSIRQTETWQSEKCWEPNGYCASWDYVRKFKVGVST